MPANWDLRYLELARFVAGWSKDPSTQTGAVIVGGRNQVVSIGFNGLPRGVADLPERLNNREVKYKMVVHCERNAMLFAGGNLEGCTLYTWPFQSCAPCAAMVVQAGIKRCVAPLPSVELAERWGEDIKLAQEIFREAGVRLDLVNV